jgi:hypothetical protein
MLHISVLAAILTLQLSDNMLLPRRFGPTELYMKMLRYLDHLLCMEHDTSQACGFFLISFTIFPTTARD